MSTYIAILNNFVFNLLLVSTVTDHGSNSSCNLIHNFALSRLKSSYLYLIYDSHTLPVFILLKLFEKDVRCIYIYVYFQNNLHKKDDCIICLLLLFLIVADIFISLLIFMHYVCYFETGQYNQLNSCI